MFSFLHKKAGFVLGIILLSQVPSVFAQSKNYSLQNLVESAHHNMPVLLQKQALINAGQAAITATRHSFLPQVSVAEQLNIASANSLAGTYFGFGVIPSTSGSIRANNDAQAVTGNIAVLYSEYELANFGLNHAKLNSAKAYADLAGTDLKKEQYLLDVDVAKIYLTILRNQYRLDADKQNIDRYQGIFNIIQALTLSGIKAGADSSLAKAELSKTKINYNQTLGTINQLREQLSYLTGIPAGSLAIDTLQVSGYNTLPNAVDYAMDTAGNPVIDYFTKARNIYVTNERLIRKSYLPKVLLAGSYWARGSSIQYNDQYKALSTGLGYQRFNYALGVVLTYNLFSGISKRDKLAINQYQLQASGYDLQQQKLSLLSSARQADNALQTTVNNLTELPVQYQSALATYQQKMAQYKAGLISLIDLTNATFVLYRSQTDYTETLSDWYMAQLDKAAATGNLQQFLNTLK